MLYEYHVPGAGTSAEYLGGDGGMASDYDAVSAPSEYFATDEKGDAPFTNAITRTDKDQVFFNVLYTHTHTHTHTIYIYACILCMYVYVCIYTIYIYIYTHIHIYIYIYIYIYTHIYIYRARTTTMQATAGRR